MLVPEDQCAVERASWSNFEDFRNGAFKRTLGDFRVIASDQDRALVKETSRFATRK